MTEALNRIPRPYETPGDVVEPSRETNGRLPRAERTQTHLERYVLRESARQRVLGLDQLTGRSQIGRRIRI